MDAFCVIVSLKNILPRCKCILCLNTGYYGYKELPFILNIQRIRIANPWFPRETLTSLPSLKWYLQTLITVSIRDDFSFPGVFIIYAAVIKYLHERKFDFCLVMFRGGIQNSLNERMKLKTFYEMQVPIIKLYLEIRLIISNIGAPYSQNCKFSISNFHHRSRLPYFYHITLHTMTYLHESQWFEFPLRFNILS